jgi:DNA adenine methylase
MSLYKCIDCGKDFSHKSKYTQHQKRKTPCRKSIDVDVDVLQKEVEEKLQELKITENKICESELSFSLGDKEYTEEIFQKPFLKWVGGKTQIIHHIIRKFPSIMENYYEPFLGGGSVLFALLTLHKHKQITIKHKIYAFDINPSLIYTYNHIKFNKDELYEYIKNYTAEYNSIIENEDNMINRKPKTIEEAKQSKENYYYWLRNKFNMMDVECIEHSALFIFLNKTCFRGVYREGPNGYNVPYGHYKQLKEIISKTELDIISDLIQKVEFKCCDFTECLKDLKKDDFVYLDPPYVPENKTSFVKYVVNGFDMKSHQRLFADIKKINTLGGKFLMSNSNMKMIKEEFKDFSMDEIAARRAIHSKKPETMTTEILIYNY